jgi:mono/diheme cytochrome c family protein
MPTAVRHGEEQAEEEEKTKAPATSPELLAEIAEKRAEFASRRAESADEPLGPWLSALDGGDAKAGENIFFHRQDAQCSRCHFVRGKGAAVGPDLSRIGDEQDARTLIESVLLPSAQLAAGFDAVPISAMPPIMKDVLNPRELRDLIAYLKTLKPRSADPPKDSVASIQFERFEGDWNKVPNLGNNPVEIGTVANFADATRQHRKGHAWRFTGYLSVADDSWYTFAAPGIASFKIDKQEWIQAAPDQPPKKLALRPGAHSFTAIYVGSNDVAEFAPTLNDQRIRHDQLSRGITVLEPANPIATSPGVDYRYFNKGAANHEFAGKRPDKLGFAEQIDFSMSDHQNSSAVEHKGYFDVPADGEYSIFVDTVNECELRISDAEIIAWNAQAGDLPQTAPLTNFDGRDFGRWRVEGKAFGRRPTHENLPNQALQDAEGGIANSFHGDKQSTGKLISTKFVIRHGYIAFKIGGGKNKAKLGLRLFIDGKKVREAVGDGAHTLVWKTWAVKELMGKTAHLEIVDEGENGWILVDTIIAVDKTKRGAASLRRGRYAFTLRAKHNPNYLDRAMAIRLQPMNGRSQTIRPLRLGPEPGREVPHIAPGVHITQLEGKAHSKLAELAKFAPKAVVIGERIDIEKRSRDTDFALALRGYIRVDTPGEYRFWIKSDDGSRFHLNGRDLMVWDGNHGHEPGWPGRALLGEGLHPFRVDMFNGGGGRHLDLLWEGPGIEKASVPPTNLFYRTMRAAEDITDLKPGLAYAYYESGDQPWKVLPDFAALRPIATGDTAYPALDIALRADRFGCRFTGYLRVPETGEYRFSTNSDDGSCLFIGDELIVDNDGQHAPQDRHGLISLEAGLHAITIDFFEAGAGESLSISVQRSGAAREALPAEWLWRK